MNTPIAQPVPTLLLTEREAAVSLRISPKSVFNARVAGKLDCIKFGRSVRYTPAQLAAYIQANPGQ